jgi:hypothetical protein
MSRQPVISLSFDILRVFAQYNDYSTVFSENTCTARTFGAAHVWLLLCSLFSLSRFDAEVFSNMFFAHLRSYEE